MVETLPFTSLEMYEVLQALQVPLLLRHLLRR
jgi:hypothetical protein